MNIETLKVTNRRAYDKVFDQWREGQCADYDWYEFTFEQAYEDGKTRGFYIDSAYKKGSSDVHSLSIYFSGFCSQGDGASWEGHVDVPEWLEWLRNERAAEVELGPCRPGNGTPFTDQQLLWIDEGYRIDWLEHRVSIRTSARGSYNMYLRDDGPWNCSAYEEDVPEGVFAGMNGDTFTSTFNEVVPDFLETVLAAARAFADEIYKNLEAEYEYLTSEESFIEAMDGVEFDEEGETV